MHPRRSTEPGFVPPLPPSTRHHRAMHEIRLIVDTHDDDEAAGWLDQLNA